MRKSLSFHSSVRYFKYIVLVLLFYPLTVLGAQGHITVKGQSITIKEAIMLIEKNSNYVFFYNAADLKNIRLKNINCSGPIDKVLNEVFANTGITYLIQGNDVVLKVSKTESAQQAKKTEIVGVVTDARTGEAVIGASVAIVGTTTGVITDIDGKFVIQAGPQDVLKISYVGYTAKEVKVGNRKVLAIDLSEDAQALEEVVVTAYGTGQKKASMVGSVQAIRPAELKVPSTNLSNSFAGRLSGVVAVQRTGRPGADGSDFWIRGISTLSEATLETALFRVPQVVCYHTPIGKVISFLRRHILTVKYISLVNLIADCEVVKELVADTMTVKNMQCELANLLENEVYKKEMLTGYDYVAERLGPAGAPCHAAHGIVKLLKK